MDAIYQCDYCIAIFSNVVDIERHIYNHLTGEEDDFKLKSANKNSTIFPNLWSILSHSEFNTHPDNKERGIKGDLTLISEEDDINIKGDLTLISEEDDFNVYKKAKFKSSNTSSQSQPTESNNNYFTGRDNTHLNSKGAVYLASDEDDFNVYKTSKFNSSNTCIQRQTTKSNVNKTIKQHKCEGNINLSSDEEDFNICKKRKSKSSQRVPAESNACDNEGRDNKQQDIEGDGNSNKDLIDEDNNNEHLGKCCICEHSFSNSFEYQNHVETECEVMETQCRNCLFFFENMDALESHHSGDLCNTFIGNSDKDTRKEANEADHLYTLTNNVIRESTPTKYTSELDEMAEVIDINSFKCGKCANYICQCGQQFSGKISYLAENPYECIFCHKSHAYIESYRRHIIEWLEHTDTGDGQLRACPKCDRKFKSDSELLRHYEIHIKLKSFKCSNLYSKAPDSLENNPIDKCLKKPPGSSDQENSIGVKESDNFYKQTMSSTQRSTDTAHVISKPSNHNVQSCSNSLAGGKRSYKCNTCDKSFDNLTQWRFHNNAFCKSKPFPCILCIKPFATLKHYRRHVNRLIHNDRGENPSQHHACPTCDLRFNTARELLKHYEIHMDRKLYKCTFCQFTNHRPDNLKNHQIEFHPEFVKQNKLSEIFDQDTRKESNEKDNISEQTVNIALESTETAHDVSKPTNHNSQCRSKSPTAEESSLKCSKCDKIFDNLAQWRFHNEAVCKNKPFQCILCQKQISSLKNYRQHVNGLKHKDTGEEHSEQHACPTCDNKFNTARELLKHYENHMDLKPYKCSFCKHAFDRPDNLSFHKINCHRGIVKPKIKCKICKGVLLGQRENHILHSIEHHKGSCFVCKKQLHQLFKLKHHVASHFGFKQCLFCNTSFQNEGMLVKHMPCSSSIFSCKTCGETFMDVVLLKYHMEGHAKKEVSAKRLCEICGFSCSTSQRLEEHHKTHGKRFAELKCNICNSYHHSLASLNIHRHVNHPPEKLYDCSFCKKSFASKKSLYLHIKNHKRKRSLEPVFKCDKCDQQFAAKSLLKKHRNIHMYDTKPYKCDQCEVAFVQNCNLTKHKLTHRDERPYACDKCDAAFKHLSNLTKHSNIHTGDFPFRCVICSAGFSVKKYLLLHKKQHVGLKLYTQ